MTDSDSSSNRGRSENWSWFEVMCVGSVDWTYVVPNADGTRHE